MALRGWRRSATAMCALAVAQLVPTGPLTPRPVRAATEVGSFVTSFDGTQIDVNVCRPAGATATAPVPVVLELHGWGGFKSTCSHRTAFLSSGIGLVTMTHRGHGASGGESHFMDPEVEGRDLLAVIDFIASLPWVRKEDGPRGSDPLLGTMGNSYGGAAQWIAALREQQLRGSTRIDAMRPANTWYDLRRAIAPYGVLRSLPMASLYARPTRVRTAPWFTEFGAASFAAGAVLDGPAPIDHAAALRRRSPALFVEDRGLRLDVPVFIRQSAADVLFDLNEAIHAFARALTPSAKRRSIFANDHAGHGAPRRLPTSATTTPLGRVDVGVPAPSGPLLPTARSSETCDAPADVEWFRHTLLGRPLELHPQLRLRTAEGACLALSSWNDVRDVEVEAMREVPVAVGMPGVQLIPLPRVARTIVGIPRLELVATVPHPDARLFWGLAIGASPEQARLLGHQWRPSRFAGGVRQRHAIALGAVIAQLSKGEHLYLAVAPDVEVFATQASRAPGVAVIHEAILRLPTR